MCVLHAAPELLKSEITDVLQCPISAAARRGISEVTADLEKRQIISRMRSLHNLPTCMGHKPHFGGNDPHLWGATPAPTVTAVPRGHHHPTAHGHQLLPGLHAPHRHPCPHSLAHGDIGMERSGAGDMGGLEGTWGHEGTYGDTGTHGDRGTWGHRGTWG